MAENFIKVIENLDDLQKLELLDLAHNKIQMLNGLSKLINLKDLWV